jgi:cyanophycinase
MTSGHKPNPGAVFVAPTVMLCRSASPVSMMADITVGATKTAPGLGLWPEVIFDQHFLKRQRHSRLISLVLEHPTLVGVGIDERTAAIVSGSRFEVLGEGAVVVFDGRKATIEARQPGQLTAARNVTMHVLTNGMAFSTRD